MDSLFSFIVGIWMTVLSLFGIAPQQPEAQQVVDQSSQPVQQEQVSVSGMSKYTDAFGFSFWYPSNWTIKNTPSAPYGKPADQQSNGALTLEGDGNQIVISKFSSNNNTYKVAAGACGYCGEVAYHFDTTADAWIKQYPKGPNGGDMDYSAEQIATAKKGAPADVSHRTMGGLPMFFTEQKESARIVPISPSKFILVNDVTYTNKCGSFCASPDIKGGAQYLAKTIVATDSSAGISLSVSEQVKIIEEEKSQYTFSQ